MKRLLFSTLLSALCLIASAIDIKDINIRDPFILPVADEGVYYMYCTSTVADSNGQPRGGVAAYKSKDLRNWEGPVQVCTIPDNNMLTGTIWAPEVHFYNGKYYLFATINSDIEWRKAEPDHPKYLFRGTQIFHADSPEGPFEAFSPETHTPADWMALDGTLWVENGKPYMVFCHEWVQTDDGTMDVVALEDDLSAPKGSPTRLFNASAAPWAQPICNDRNNNQCYVTDGCFLYRTKTGKLLMIWSSFTNGNNYAIGIAESTTGSVLGPWRQQEKPLFTTNGGHGMIFKRFDGQPCIVLHQPNSPQKAERARIFEIDDLGTTLNLRN